MPKQAQASKNTKSNSQVEGDILITRGVNPDNARYHVGLANLFQQYADFSPVQANLTKRQWWEERFSSEIAPERGVRVVVEYGDKIVGHMMVEPAGSDGSMIPVHSLAVLPIPGTLSPLNEHSPRDPNFLNAVLPVAEQLYSVLLEMIRISNAPGFTLMVESDDSLGQALARKVFGSSAVAVLPMHNQLLVQSNKAQETTTVYATLSNKPTPTISLSVPLSHRAFCRSLFGQIGLNCLFPEVAEHTDKAQGSITTSFVKHLGFHLIRINPGHKMNDRLLGLSALLNRWTKDRCKKMLFVIDGTKSHAAESVMILEELGYTSCGILPCGPGIGCLGFAHRECHIERVGSQVTPHEGENGNADVSSRTLLSNQIDVGKTTPTENAAGRDGSMKEISIKNGQISTTTYPGNTRSK